MTGPKPLARRVIRVNGVELFNRDTETPHPPILCLHGRWGRGETWTDLIARYRDRYRIIAPDQRGHGLSGRPIARYAAEDFALDAHMLLQSLGCGPAIVVGHSMGGRIAAHLAGAYPDDVKAVAILDSSAEGKGTPSSVTPEKITPFDRLTAAWPLPYASYEEAIRDLEGRYPRKTNVRYFLESLVETAAGYDYMFSRYAMAAITEYAQRWYDVLPRIICPVWLVRAVDSWELSAEVAARMRAEIRDCSYTEIKNSDHMVYADNPDEFYPEMDRFLGRLPGASRSAG
jgi:pimeloyl-ACP methyl ester carboxylesterase